jgi:hypothetical protein
MSNIVWQSPAPSSGFLRGVDLQIRPQREAVLIFEFEDDVEEMRTAELIFKDVVHYRTTYMVALRAELIQQAYDRLVDLPESTELRKIIEATKANGQGSDYRHYRICFDDGPCFDFICRSFAFKMT